MMLNISRKLSKVGDVGKNFGGKIQSSSNGLNEFPMISTIGIAINAAKTNRNRMMANEPARERLTRLLLFRERHVIRISVTHFPENPLDDRVCPHHYDKQNHCDGRCIPHLKPGISVILHMMHQRMQCIAAAREAKDRVRTSPMPKEPVMLMTALNIS